LRNSKKKLLFFIIFGLLNIDLIYSQSIKEIDLYNWYDKTVGKVNLDINNGVVHTNPYQTSDGNNIYFVDDKFEAGTLSYDKQTYYETSLKYDIYRDILILNPYGVSELIGINLSKDKVDSFSIYNRNFIKLRKEQYHLPDFETGYYEIFEDTSDFVFYIKHSKEMQKEVREDGVYYQFKPVANYFLAYKKTLYTVDRKSDIIKIFPNQKKQINEFYLINREVKKSEQSQFMKNLMKRISNSLSNENKSN